MAAPSSVALTQWTMASTPAGATSLPQELSETLDWLPAQVPGTVAGALRAAGRLDLMNPAPLDAQDHWFHTRLDTEGPASLTFEGLATVAEIFLDGVCVGTSNSMYVPVTIDVPQAGRHSLDICFRAMAPLLDTRGPRARWRPRMVSPQTLRLWRMTFLGRMPGWCPPVHAIGPYRAVTLRQRAPAFELLDWSTRYEDGCGTLSVTLRAAEAQEAILSCDGREIALGRDGKIFSGTLSLPGVAPWWPHTHGTPTLHDVNVALDGRAHSLGRTGFRKIALDRGADGKGFAIRVNDVPVFCRGACWTSADVVSLDGTRAALEPLLAAARDANMNMIRVGGTMLYETDSFFDLCDEMGLLVWQDFALSNFDYPAKDEGWCTLLATEADALLTRTRRSAALAILCGGSEIWQQAAMLGLPESAWQSPQVDALLSDAVSRLRPDCAFVPNTPSGGALPFEPRQGVTHYYGVSAYMRPLRDARDAQVRFAAECLGFAHVPDDDVALEPDRAAIVQPCWSDRVPGDVGAVWYFEEVRNHYLRELFGVDPEALRREDPARYLAFSRATTVEIVEDVFASWRRTGSCTQGGLVWFLRDVVPGAGWGVIGFDGSPKPVWHGLRRAFRPVQVLLADEGLNGLDVHVVNETANAKAVTLKLTCLRDGTVPVMQASRDVTLAPRSSVALPATDLWGAFFDTAYAYRFGPPSHDVTIATLVDPANGEVLAQAFHHPLGRDVTPRDIGLAAELFEDDAGWALRVSTLSLALGVHVRDDHHLARDHWCHVAPGFPKIVRLAARRGHEAAPCGCVHALNSRAVISYGERA